MEFLRRPKFPTQTFREKRLIFNEPGPEKAPDASESNPEKEKLITLAEEYLSHLDNLASLTNAEKDKAYINSVLSKQLNDLVERLNKNPLEAGDTISTLTQSLKDVIVEVNALIREYGLTTPVAVDLTVEEPEPQTENDLVQLMSLHLKLSPEQIKGALQYYELGKYDNPDFAATEEIINKVRNYIVEHKIKVNYLGGTDGAAHKLVSEQDYHEKKAEAFKILLQFHDAIGLEINLDLTDKITLINGYIEAVKNQKGREYIEENKNAFLPGGQLLDAALAVQRAQNLMHALEGDDKNFDPENQILKLELNSTKGKDHRKSGLFFEEKVAETKTKPEIVEIDGVKYEGVWDENENFKGVKISPDGEKEEGAFYLNGKLERGSRYYPDGTIEEGRFDNEGQLITGALKKSNGLREEGSFGKSGNLLIGTRTYPDGIIEDGTFDLNGKLINGFKKHPDGREEQGLWNEGQLLQTPTIAPTASSEPAPTKFTDEIIAKIAKEQDYEKIIVFTNNIAWAKKEGEDKEFYINEKGEKLWNQEFDEVGEFYYGLAKVKNGGEYFYINQKAERVETDFDEQWAFSNDSIARARKGDKYFFINTERKKVWNVDYEFANGFHENLASVKKDGKYFFINMEGKQMWEKSFEDARDFHAGLAPVKENGRWFYVNKNGEPQWNQTFDDAKVIDENGAKVKIGAKWFYLNLRGRKRGETSE